MASLDLVDAIVNAANDAHACSSYIGDPGLQPDRA